MELENEGPIIEIDYDKADLDDESEGSLKGSVETSSEGSAEENIDEKLQDLIQSQQPDLDIMDKEPWIHSKNRDVPPKISKFKAQVSPTSQFKDFRPIDFFHLILKPEYTQDIVFYTNEYAATKFDNGKNRQKKKAFWRNTNEVELKGFIGMLILMGLVKKTKLTSYWDQNELSTPFIADSMPKSRFFMIYHSFCLRPLDDERNMGGKFKFSLMSDHVIWNSQKEHQPRKELSLDESNIPFRGKHSWKIYMPSKPIKYGFKAYVLTEARSGYVLNWQLVQETLSSILMKSKCSRYLPSSVLLI